MHVYISFYRDLSDKVRRKQIHIVDNPTTLFRMMSESVIKTEWNFYAYQVDVDPQYVYVLYRGFYNTDIPPVIECETLTYWYCDTVHYAKINYQLHD